MSCRVASRRVASRPGVRSEAKLSGAAAHERQAVAERGHGKPRGESVT